MSYESALYRVLPRQIWERVAVGVGPDHLTSTLLTRSLVQQPRWGLNCLYHVLVVVEPLVEMLMNPREWVVANLLVYSLPVELEVGGKLRWHLDDTYVLEPRRHALMKVERRRLLAGVGSDTILSSRKEQVRAPEICLL